MARVWQDGAGIPINAANLNGMETDISAARSNAVAESKAYVDAQGIIPGWKASTTYAAGQRVIAPSGDVVAAKANFTSGTTYSATNWNASTQDGRIGALEGVAPTTNDGTSYLWAWVDSQDHVALGIKPDGSVEVGGRQVLPKAVRSTAVALTVSDGSSTDARTAAQVRLPLKLGVDATITAIHFRNYRDRSGLAFTGSLSFVGTYWGVHAQSGSGALTGNFTAAPTQLAGAATTPADGSEYKISGLSIPVKAGAEYLLSYAYTCAAQTNYAGVGGCWTNSTTGDVSAQSAVQTVAQYAPLDVWLEIETTAPIIAYMGDSLSAGVGNELPMYQSPPALHGRANGYVPLMYTHSGSAMTSWVGNGSVKYTKWAGLGKPDALVFSLGKNDINGTVTTSELRTKFGDVYATASAAISNNIYLTTVLPSVNDADATGATRRAWNDILLNEKLGNAVMVFDIAKALAVAGGTGMDPVYDTGDGTHLNKRGSNSVASSISQTLHG